MTGRPRHHVRTRPEPLSTAERLVVGHLGEVAAGRPRGVRIELAVAAACCCLSEPVVAAAVEALVARRVIVTHADGRLALAPGKPR